MSFESHHSLAAIKVWEVRRSESDWSHVILKSRPGPSTPPPPPSPPPPPNQYHSLMTSVSTTSASAAIYIFLAARLQPLNRPYVNAAPHTHELVLRVETVSLAASTEDNAAIITPLCCCCVGFFFHHPPVEYIKSVLLKRQRSD